ncbi:MAG: carboxypeptidase regulatory-like domain-containing protein [Chloroflexi bacterium]|nr:carboxypeptidase regulatory-like domain-containing protein [Chloroflexota bacterium]
MLRILRMLTAALLALALLWLARSHQGAFTVSALPATSEKIFVAIDAGDALADATLYSLNPDGSGQTPIFDFHSHPHDTRGSMTDLRQGAGGAIYFTSDNAYLFTPASRNLFRVAADGSWWDQITPGPNSGRWDQPCPCGTVTGIVRNGAGDPWSGRPVFLEGKDMVYSGADGRFRFDNVPTGTRWLLAYRNMGEDVFDSQAISVNAGLITDVALSPSNNVRMEFSHPVPSGNRIYTTLWPFTIQWTTADFAPPVDVYTTSGACNGIPSIDGFDVAPSSGRLAIVNYEEGCGIGDTEHQGVYLADKDGHNLRLLVNMMADPNWCGAQEVFWSPDESKLAVKACYQWHTYLVVFDAGNGNVLGSVYFNDQSYTLYNVSLYGWSPGGDWLLYSSWLNDFASGTLVKMAVNADGSLDVTNAAVLLHNTRITAATWGRTSPPSSQQRLYIPFVTK